MLPRTVQLRDSEAEKELPDTASGPQLRHRRSASAPRRALVVLRTPMDPAPCPAPVEKKTAKVTITATGQLCCTQQLVGDPGVPVATSLFLVLSRRDSCERAIIGLGLRVSGTFRSRFALRLVRHSIFAPTRAIDPFGAQSFPPIGRGATYT